MKHTPKLTKTTIPATTTKPELLFEWKHSVSIDDNDALNYEEIYEKDPIVEGHEKDDDIFYDEEYDDNESS